LKAREQPPQVGFNNNVRHRGLVFHIQTEDSGVHHPHVTTHLFVDGGRIVKSQRMDYRHLLGSENLAAELRALMKEQHKAMYLGLRSGALDGLLGDLPLAPAAETPGLDRASVVAEVGTISQRFSQGAAAPSLMPSLAPREAPSTAPPLAVRKPRGVGGPAIAPPLSEAAPAPSSRDRQVPSGPVPPSSGSVSSGAHLDFPLTPRPSATPSEQAAGGGRYRAPRPAAIFATPGADSLFGGGTNREPSLDDVILNYLSGTPELDVD
jgi:hypothetical protein